MATSRLVAVDSGASSGFACFLGGELIVAALVSIDTIHDGLFCSADECLVEIPDRVKVNPKSIIKLAINAGRWIERFGLRTRAEIRAVEASAWKASTDPDILARRIIACLTPEEMARVPRTRAAIGYDHNVLDAIGLGLWRLGRMGRGGRKIR